MEERIDFRRYLAVIVRWWWLVLLTVAVTGGTAYWYSKAQEPIYEASTKLLIQQQVGSSALSTAEDIGLSERLAKTYTIVIKTAPVVDGVTQRLNLKLPPGAVQRALSVDVIQDTPILEIRARSTNPGQARDIANATAEVFIEQNRDRLLSEIARLGAAMSAKGLSQSTDFLSAQVNAIGSVEILEPAKTPENPVYPSTSRNTLLTVILGAMVGLAGAFYLDYLKEGVRTEEDVEHLGLTCLGIVPEFRRIAKSETSLILRDDPNSYGAEAFRVLRANLCFSLAGKAKKVLMVTSAFPEEGKTTVTANLAAALAQGGQRTVLVDVDLRRPRVHLFFGLENDVGTSNMLADPERRVPEFLRDTEIYGLRVLPSGPRPPNPVELIQSQQMRSLLSHLREEGDLVLLDSTPLLGVADAVTLAPQVDGVVLVINAGKTKPKEIAMAKSALEKTGASLLGAVLNNLETGRHGYYDYHYYHRYYSYGDDGHTGASGKKRWSLKVLGRFLRAGKRGQSAAKQT